MKRKSNLIISVVFLLVISVFSIGTSVKIVNRFIEKQKEESRTSYDVDWEKLYPFSESEKDKQAKMNMPNSEGLFDSKLVNSYKRLSNKANNKKAKSVNEEAKSKYKSKYKA